MLIDSRLDCQEELLGSLVKVGVSLSSTELKPWSDHGTVWEGRQKRAYLLCSWTLLCQSEV